MRNSSISNLKRHNDVCAKYKKHDTIQIMLDHNDELSTRVLKFEAQVIRELLS